MHARAAGPVDHLAAIVAVIATTALSRAAGPVLALPDVVLLYLFAISATAYRSGRGPALVAATASVAAYNFFFVAPYHTFAVADLRHLLTFAVMFGVGLAISTFAERARVQQADALERERRIVALYDLTRDLSAASDEDGVARAVVKHAEPSFGRAGLAAVTEAGDIVGPLGTELGPVDRAAVLRCARTGAPTGTEAAGAIGARVWCLPVLAAGAPTVLVLARDRPVDRDHAEAFAQQVGSALERVRLAARAETATLRARTEEVKSALLSTVSHDLRTPLAAITGAATALLEPTLPPDRRRELTEGIRDEAFRLERLVGNLLDMTRVASGSLDPRREWVPLEELLGTALQRVERSSSDHPVSTLIAHDLPMLRVDAVLIEHVLVNLLENAVRHTPVGTPITVRGHVRAGEVEVEVADRGPGLPVGDPTRWFEPFVRGAGQTGGSGLGLAICRGIVRAHGGEIEADSPPGGGAVFRFRLPVEEQPPAVPTGAFT